MRWVGFSTIFAGITGYLVIYLATSTLGAERFDAFNVFWALFFAISGIVQGLMHETTRGVRVAAAADERTDMVDENDNGIHDADELVVSESSTGTTVIEVLSPEEIAADQRRRLAARGSHRIDPESLRHAARPLTVGIGLGVVLGLLLLLTSPLWAPPLLPPEHRALGSALIPIATVLLAVQAAFAGLLSGTGRWRGFGMLLTAEAALRLIVAAIATGLGDPMAGFLYATVAGAIVTPAALLAPPGRALLRLRTDVPVRTFVARSGGAMLAASAAAVLVVGFPVILQATRPGTEPVVLSNLLLAVLLTRAPILTPITSFQNALVVHFVNRSADARRAVVVPVAGVLAIGLVGAFLAWFLGPPIIEFMGEGFTIGGEVLAMLTFAASLTGALYVSGAAVLAREHHGHYVAGWWIASLLSIAVLIAVPQIVPATELALIIGPAAGLVYHVVAGLRGPAPAARGADRLAPTGPVGGIGPAGAPAPLAGDAAGLAGGAGGAASRTAPVAGTDASEEA